MPHKKTKLSIGSISYFTPLLAMGCS